MVANHSLSVLAIEDDLDTQANLRDILELDGYRVASAGTMREALDRNNWSEFSADLFQERTDALELVGSTRRAIQQLQRLLEEVRAFAAPLN